MEKDVNSRNPCNSKTEKKSVSNIIKTLYFMMIN